MKLKRLHQQVIVVTGASSGIGRVTAQLLARRGATVVGMSRSEATLRSLVDEITEQGGTARYLVCDVSDLAQLQAAANQVEQWFGRIDTWVNNAGVLLYGTFARTPPDDFRRIMDINFMGAVNGSRVALPALRRAGGGALITVSSVEAAFTLPLHSAYAASKHAVDGAMAGLRRELISDRAPISLTVIRPSVIDTPAYLSARNHTGMRPSAPPPFYDPVIVARCIAYAAAHPIRDVYAGGMGWAMSALQSIAPSAVDWILARSGIRLMHTGRRAHQTAGNLHAAGDSGVERGGLPRPGRRWSVYTWLALHPRSRRVLMASALLGAAALVRRRRGPHIGA